MVRLECGSVRKTCGNCCWDQGPDFSYFWGSINGKCCKNGRHVWGGCLGSVSLDSAVSHYLFPYFNPPGVCLVALDRKVDFQPLGSTVPILSGISGLPHSKMYFREAQSTTSDTSDNFKNNRYLLGLFNLPATNRNLILNTKQKGWNYCPPAVLYVR